MTRSPRVEWFKEAKWGVFMHFLGAPPSSGGGAELDAEAWNRRVDGFDVEGLAVQLRKIRARYFFITLRQNSGHYCSPNDTYDRITGVSPSKCSRRDLVGDLQKVLAPSGINLMVYLPSHAPMNDPVATRNLGFVAPWGFGGWSPPPGTYTAADAIDNDERLSRAQRNWEAVIREWSLRWGNGVRGWWFDGCYYIDKMYKHADEPNFKSFAAAARVGNPDSIVAWNPGVMFPRTVDVEEDYTAGEVNEPWNIDSPGRWIDQAQFHVLTFLGEYWGRGPVRFRVEDAIAHTRAITDYDGVFTWDVPLTPNGLITEEAVAALSQIGEAVDGTRGRQANLPRHVLMSMTIPEPPRIKVDGSSAAGRVALTLSNPWEEPITGEVELRPVPANALTVENGGKVPYTLPVGGSAVCALKVEAAADLKAPRHLEMILRRNGNPRHVRRWVPLVWEVALPGSDKQEVGEKYRKTKRFTIDSPCGTRLAEVKFSLQGKGLLLLGVDVHDSALRWAKNPWDGSCVEFFAARDHDAPVVQLFLLPKTDKDEAAVMRVKSGGGWERVAEVKYKTWAAADGYIGGAVIPLPWLFGEEEPPRWFCFEVGITAGVTADSFTRSRLFGVDNASVSAVGYGEAVISGRESQA